MSVETKVLNLVNYITGSSGGWPSLSRAGIVGSVDYVIESGSDDIYFYELNTNVLNTGGLSDQQSVYNEWGEKGIKLQIKYMNKLNFNKQYYYSLFGGHQVLSTLYGDVLISE